MALEAADRYAEALELSEQVIALARRRGDRRWESNLQTGMLVARFLLGRWDEALVIAAEEEPRAAAGNARAQLLEIARIHRERGDFEPADRLLAASEPLRDSDNRENRTAFAAIEARLLRAHGRLTEALAAAERELATLGELPITDTYIKAALVEAVEAALALGDLDEAERLLAIPETLDPGQLTPLLEARTSRLRARLDAARGSQGRVDEQFRTSITLYD